MFYVASMYLVFDAQLSARVAVRFCEAAVL